MGGFGPGASSSHSLGNGLLSFLAERYPALAGSFFTPLPPGKAEVLVLNKKA